MKFFRAVGPAIVLSTSASMLAACGLSQGSVGPNSPSTEFALPNPATSSDLIYAARERYVEVYSYPDGALQTAFTEKGSANGMCADSSGNVFAAVADVQGSNSAGYVYEYAHGATAPAATLDAPKNDLPQACSVDPTTGNLAVTMQNAKDFEPSVAIYTKASGTPKVYHSNVLGAYPQAAYDGGGNLLATSGGNTVIELAKGQSAFTKITLEETLGGVAHVQWDGKYFALQSFDVNKHNGEKIFERIYRIALSGSTGKVAGITRFDGWPEKDAGQSWITGSTILATPYSKIGFWAYPAGGKPTKTVHSARAVKAITLSVAGH
jgi:hypothetical protein